MTNDEFRMTKAWNYRRRRLIEVDGSWLRQISMRNSNLEFVICPEWR